MTRPDEAWVDDDGFAQAEDTTYDGKCKPGHRQDQDQGLGSTQDVNLEG